MTTHRSTGEHGPSWGDLLAMLDDLRETYSGHVRVEITPQPLSKWGDRRGLYARVVWYEKPGALHTGERAAGGAWPSGEHRTMPGMLFRLAHDLERLLEDLAHDNAMAAGWKPSDGALHELAPRHPHTPKRGG